MISVCLKNYLIRNSFLIFNTNINKNMFIKTTINTCIQFNLSTQVPYLLNIIKAHLLREKILFHQSVANVFLFYCYASLPFVCTNCLVLSCHIFIKCVLPHPWEGWESKVHCLKTTYRTLVNSAPSLSSLEREPA